ncbi:hypothetical protein Gotri_025907 [Gossypium trilobum]|uniref:Uncharacterized protein n=1 Tax=Gossypium trilobum TaxID=34281 RepID=A0A7J9FU40_9ROSI|nr:hypothetical protein [Gossypium trilobum]
MMLNGKLIGWCPTRSYIDAGTLTGSLYLEFGELSDIPHYSMIITRERFEKCLTLESKFTGRKYLL